MHLSIHYNVYLSYYIDKSINTRHNNYKLTNGKHNMTTADKKYKYSEIFFSFQGEGNYTGIPTAWLRLWGCNVSCSGFGQSNIDDQSTWDLVYKKLDFSKYKRMEDLPMLNKCCDSGYSHEKEFAHLAMTDTVVTICDKIEESMKSRSNPDGLFLHPKSKQWTHMAFTGGEPMMNQNAIVDVMLEFAKRGNMPKYVTVETNGTQVARDKFNNYITGYDTKASSLDDALQQSEHSFYMSYTQTIHSEQLVGLPGNLKALQGVEWFWSVSPKLFLSGEKRSTMLKPDVVSQYAELSNHGQLKYVVDGSDRAWQEVEEFTAAYRAAGVNFPVWIMPMGASIEGQELIQKDVAIEAIQRGYNVAARVHCFVFNNTMGT